MDFDSGLIIKIFSSLTLIALLALFIFSIVKLFNPIVKMIFYLLIAALAFVFAIFILNNAFDLNIFNEWLKIGLVI